MTKNICIIVSGTLTNSISLYLCGIKKRAEALGYYCTIFSMLKFDRLDLGNQMKVYDLIDFSRYCGVIFLENSFAPHKSCGSRIEERLKERSHLPVVVIGESDQGFPSINHETKEPFIELTNHMIEDHNCRIIYCLGGTKMRRSGRIEGFMEALESHNIPCPPEYIFYGGYWKECAENLAKNIAHGNVEKPDAVICLTDHIAYQLVKSLMEYGYEIPEDIRVAGFSGYDCVFNKSMPLTTYQIDFDYIGAMAVTMLHEKLTGELPPSVPQKKQHIILGGSCGCNALPKRVKRQLFEEIDREEMCDMFFENSGIEYAFMECESVADVMNEVKRLNYLVPEKTLLAVNLYHAREDLWCHFISNLLEDADPIPLRNGNLLPPKINYMEECDNLTVLPISFKDRVLGYVLVGYKAPVCHDKFLLRFIDQLTHGLILQEKQKGKPEENVSEETEIPKTPATEYLFVKNGDSLQKLPLELVYYFETVDRHVYAVTKGGAYEIGKKMYELEDELNPEQFLRVSKSVILSLGKISSLHRQSNRTIEVQLLNKKTVHVSRNYIDAFQKKVRV